MFAWSPILVQQIEIHALGFVLRKLQLNRHREAEVAPHTHDCTQLILYLAGEGVQTVKGVKHRARPGDLFVIPAGVPHGFSVIDRSRPLCLVLDYEVKASARARSSHRRLPTVALNELHALLARVPTKGRPTLADYPAILAVVARLLDQTRVPGPAPRNPPLYEQVSDLFRRPASSVAKVARAAGYHPDHLSRKLKRETGLGLRALRDRQRLETAQAALLGNFSVAEAATQAGFDDSNYFARWFRRQTGQTPSAWRK
jgi:AraC-like DNA-binding protein